MLSTTKYLIEKNSLKILQAIQAYDKNSTNKVKLYDYIGDIICKTLEKKIQEQQTTCQVTIEELHTSICEKMQRDWGIWIIKNEDKNSSLPPNFISYEENIIKKKIYYFTQTYIKRPKNALAHCGIWVNQESYEKIANKFYNNKGIYRSSQTEVDRFIQDIKNYIEKNSSLPNNEEHSPQIESRSDLGSPSNNIVIPTAVYPSPLPAPTQTLQGQYSSSSVTNDPERTRSSHPNSFFNQVKENSSHPVRNPAPIEQTEEQSPAADHHKKRKFVKTHNTWQNTSVDMGVIDLTDVPVPQNKSCRLPSFEELARSLPNDGLPVPQNESCRLPGFEELARSLPNDGLPVPQNESCRLPSFEELARSLPNDFEVFPIPSFQELTHHISSNLEVPILSDIEYSTNYFPSLGFLAHPAVNNPNQVRSSHQQQPENSQESNFFDTLPQI